MLKSNEENSMSFAEFMRLLIKKIKLIILIIAIFLITAIIYTSDKQKMYEASATLEIGHINENNKQKKYLEPSDSLVRKLFTQYILIESKDLPKYSPVLSTVTRVKKLTGFIELTTEATSNDLAVKKMQSILDKIIFRHNEQIEDQMALNKVQISSLHNLKNELVKNVRNLKEQIIPGKEKKINKLDIEFSLLDERPLITSERIYPDKYVVLQQMDTSHQILNSLKKDISNMEAEIISIEEKIKLLEVFSKEYNIQPTRIVGSIITYDRPVSPKTPLIITLSIFLGLVLAVFVVLLGESFRNDKEDK